MVQLLLIELLDLMFLACSNMTKNKIFEIVNGGERTTELDWNNLYGVTTGLKGIVRRI